MEQLYIEHCTSNRLLTLPISLIICKKKGNILLRQKKVLYASSITDEVKFLCTF